MIIRQHGRKYHPPVTFKCKKCHCLYTAEYDKGDYRFDRKIINSLPTVIPISNCPECGFMNANRNRLAVDDE